MVRRSFVTLFAGCFACLGLLATGGHDIASAASKTANKKPITNPKFDPNAEEVELFAAIEAGQVDAKLIPKNALGGTVFIENKTDKPLNVKVPEAVIAAPIHAQMGGMGMGGGMGGMGGGMGGMGGMGGGGGQMMGGGMGGGMGGMGGGMGGMGGGMGGMGGMGGGGFFSVPPERIVAVKFSSVCLQHGRPEPTAASKYRLHPVSRVSKDPVLYELLATVGTGRVDGQAAQAAAWSISDKMSWQQLANKSVEHLGGGQPPTPYFTQEQILAGQMLLAQATERSVARKDDKPATAPATTPEPRTARTTATK